MCGPRPQGSNLCLCFNAFNLWPFAKHPQETVTATEEAQGPTVACWASPPSPTRFVKSDRGGGCSPSSHLFKAGNDTALLEEKAQLGAPMGHTHVKNYPHLPEIQITWVLHIHSC
jgi:hypothetical protein